MNGNKSCGTCAGRGVTTQFIEERGMETIFRFVPCPDCALVPELAKVKAERANG